LSQRLFEMEVPEREEKKEGKEGGERKRRI